MSAPTYTCGVRPLAVMGRELHLGFVERDGEEVWTSGGYLDEVGAATIAGRQRAALEYHFAQHGVCWIADQEAKRAANIAARTTNKVARARLTRGAPAVLAALEETVRLLELHLPPGGGDPETLATLESARAAIAFAKGEPGG